jgi:hypothetical protein
MKNIFNYAFFIFVFYPYLTIYDFGSDMQPWALLVGVFYLIKYQFSLNRIDIILATLMIYSVSLLLISNIDFQSVRSIFNYVNLFVCAFTTYKILNSKQIIFESFVKISIIVWLLVGILQIIFNKTLFSFLLPSMRTTEDRGVTSLATEPTFFGIILIFYIIIMTHLNFKNRNIYIISCVMGIIFLAQSSMVIVFIMIILFYYFITHLSIKSLLMGLGALYSAYIIVQQIMQESRIFNLTKLVFDNPMSLLLLDASVNDRFFHIYFSFKGSFDNYFIPNGYSKWSQYAMMEIDRYSIFVEKEWFSINGRIMSGYGALFFELGIFAIFIPLMLTVLLWGLYNKKLKKFFFYSLTLNTIMLSSIPVGLTVFGFYIGFLNYLNNKSLKEYN